MSEGDRTRMEDFLVILILFVVFAYLLFVGWMGIEALCWLVGLR